MTPIIPVVPLREPYAMERPSGDHETSLIVVSCESSVVSPVPSGWITWIANCPDVPAGIAT